MKPLDRSTYLGKKAHPFPLFKIKNHLFMKQRNLLFFKTWWTCLSLMFVFNFSFGQIKVTGTVTDADDKTTLIGVNIIVKGTSEGTTSDFDGNYSIEVPSENSVLVFSYTGYPTQEITVGNKRVIDFAFKASSTALDEVVVVGYTTRKRGELTGSVSTINAETIERTANKDVVKSLAGKVTGLIVSDRGGYVGSTNDVTLLIRGKSTLGNNTPLILIDGIPSNTFAHLSPQDIESLSILKDGAAAIYGARAANGVILITTKRGKEGAPKINVSSAYSLSSFSNRPNLMSSEQYAIYRNEAADRNGIPMPFSTDDISKYAAGTDPLYPSTDWADATFADYQPEWRNTISISGGSDKVKYFVSGDYINQVGLFKSGSQNWDQYQVRSNIDVKLHDKFSIGLDLSGQFADRNAPGVGESFIYKHIYTNEPGEVSVHPNGLNAWGGENGANPLIMSGDEGGFVKRKDRNLRSRISYNWDLGGVVDGLSVRGFTGIRNWNTDTKTWYTPWTVYTFQQGTNEYIQQKGFSQQGAVNSLRERAWQFNELMLNTTIHYDKSFGDHSFKSFVGTERFTSNTREFWAQRQDFPSNNVPELFAGSDEGQISNGFSAESARLNYFGSVSYDYKKKYFLDVTVRHDGSNNFGPGNRFGTFPSVAAAWSIGNESFMEGTSGWLNALKLRASWALMGNDRIAPFQWQTRYNFGNTNPNTPFPNYYTFGVNGVRYNGYASSTVPNPDVTWETADMKNIGLSFAILDYKLTGDINYFYQKRTDILGTRNASIPVAAGLTLPQENFGEVDNFGLELELGWNDKIGNVNYNLGFNFTQARNKIIFLDEAADVPDGLKREGFSIDSYVVYPTNGIFNDEAEVEATAVTLGGTKEGEPIYIDTNDDGVINAADRIRIHSSNVPEIQYGILGGLSYKGFDFSFLLQGQAKAEMLVFFDQSGALPEYVFTERWTPDNRDARYPRAFQQDDSFSGNQSGNAGNFQGADLWLHDASFLRLKEVELGYSFSKEQVRVGNLRVYFRGLNLLTMFSEVYDLGLDPEAVGYNNFRNARTPSLKSYSFGLNLTF